MEAPSAIFSASLFVGSFMKSHYTKCADERQSFRRSELRDCKTVPSLTSPDSALYDQAIAGTGSQLHFLSTGWSGWRGLLDPVQCFSFRIEETWANRSVRPSSPRGVNVHLPCQARSTRSRFQSRANSKVLAYIRSKPIVGHARPPGSRFPAMAGVCQSCASVFRVRYRQLPLSRAGSDGRCNTI